MEKGIDEFKRVIKEHLDARAERDELFAVSYAKEDKSIDKCVDYIIEQVRKSGRIGFDDDEIFSLAVHYYVEDDIDDAPGASGVTIVSNHKIELSESEKEEIRNSAMEQYRKECLAETRKLNERPRKTEKKSANAPSMANLFDL